MGTVSSDSYLLYSVYNRTCRLDGFDLWGSSPSGYIVPASSETNDEDPSAILTAYLGHSVSLIRKSSSKRPWGMAFSTADHLLYKDPETSFSDFLPFLFLSTTSLSDAQIRIRHAAQEDVEHNVNSKEKEWINKTLDITRFRPNIILKGISEPYAEEDWLEIEIEKKIFQFLIRCGRCMVSSLIQHTLQVSDLQSQFPNVDPSTGIRDSLEPNHTMMKYRKVEKTWPGKYNMG